MANDLEQGQPFPFSPVAEPLPSPDKVDPWLWCHTETGFGSRVCRDVVMAILTGSNIVDVMVEYGLDCEAVMSIRKALDEYTTHE